jgi:hypothetical protein
MTPNIIPDLHIIDKITVNLPMATILTQARTKTGSKAESQLENLISSAQEIARPKAMYKVAYIESRSDDTVTIDNKIFTSRILRVNLEKKERVFVYLATCGEELDQWSSQFDDLLKQFWADLIKQTALFSIKQILQKHIESQFRPGQMSYMSPGSLEDWPLAQQNPLFQLFDGAPSSIGLRLTDSCLMIPTKSVSGIFFSTEETFESCQLCTRPKCQNRKAAYRPTLWEKYN